MYRQANFGSWNVIGLGVIYKNTFANLCKSINHVMIIPVYDFYFKYEKVRKKRKCKISWERKEL